MKTFKEFLQDKGISDADFMAKSAEEVAKLTAEYNNVLYKALNDKINKAATQDALESVENAIRKFMGDSDNEEAIKDVTVKGLVDTLRKQGEEITLLKDSGKGNDPEQMSLKEAIKSALLEEKEAFESLKDDRKATLTFTVKAAGTMLTTTNLTPVGNRIARTENDGLTRFVRRNPFILQIVSNRSTNAKVVYWTEMVNEDGTVAMTAEGAVKSQVDWDYVEASAEVRKMTAFTKVSKEMLDDVDGFAEDIEAELTERMLLFLDDRVLKADGTGIEIVGIDTNATPFAAGSLANTIDGANDTDAIRAAIAQVYRSLFEPNYILVHPDKLAAMDLQKGTDGHYLMPPFVSASGMAVSGIPVISNTNVGVDDFYVGDFSRYIFKLREGISIQLGYDADDWTKNLITPLAEMRGVGYIPQNHYGAIVKGVFTTAKAALETI